MLYMLYTTGTEILSYNLSTLGLHALSLFLPFFVCIGLRRRRVYEEPVLRGKIPDRVRVRRAAGDGGQKRLERWRDGLVRPRLEPPFRTPRDELPELLRSGDVLLRRELVPVWKSDFGRPTRRRPQNCVCSMAWRFTKEIT